MTRSQSDPGGRAARLRRGLAVLGILAGFAGCGGSGGERPASTDDTSGATTGTGLGGMPQPKGEVGGTGDPFGQPVLPEKPPLEEDRGGGSY